MSAYIFPAQDWHCWIVSLELIFYFQNLNPLLSSLTVFFLLLLSFSLCNWLWRDCTFVCLCVLGKKGDLGNFTPSLRMWLNFLWALTQHSAVRECWKTKKNMKWLSFINWERSFGRHKHSPSSTLDPTLFLFSEVYSRRITVFWHVWHMTTLFSNSVRCSFLL